MTTLFQLHFVTLMFHTAFRLVTVSVPGDAAEWIPGYSIGRLSEGQFEYPSLNGWMTPRRAVRMCEEDLMCGGFTYKGSLIMDKKYNIYFFQLAMIVEKDRDSWKWIYYKIQRQFSTFPGIFTNRKEKKKKGKIEIPHMVNVEDAEKLCLLKDHECVGFVETKDNAKAALLDYIDMDTFEEHPNKITKVKMTNIDAETNIDAKNSWDDLNFCCPKSKTVNPEKLIGEIEDKIKRISCDISEEDFVEEYVKKRQVVVLVNCSSEWFANNHWTINSLLNQRNGEIMWDASFDLRNTAPAEAKLLKKYENEDLISGTVLQEIIASNGTIKVFDRIAKKKHTGLRKELGRLVETDKMALFEEYEAPKPVPKDYFEHSGILTDYQWMILGNGDTGTGLHFDPDFADAWNTLISGHKWWTFLPPDLDPDYFACQEECSVDESLSIYQWYTHVLPQLKERVFYGRTIGSVLQKPGETLFLPGNLGHSVMDLGDTVAVTENYNLISNLEDLVHGVMTGENLLDEDGLDDVPRLWKALYYKHVDKHARNVMRQMRQQVEIMAIVNPDACNQKEENEDKEEEDESDEDESDEDDDDSGEDEEEDDSIDEDIEDRKDV